MFSLAFLIFVLCFVAEAFGSTIITTYSDSDCTGFISSIDGAETGECQENILGDYVSFSVTSVDTTCVVTFYSGDSFCSSTAKWAATLETCYTNSNITQFSVDGCDAAASSSATLAAPLSSTSLTQPSTFSKSTSSPVSSTKTSSSMAGGGTATIPAQAGTGDNSSDGGLSATASLVLKILLPLVIGVIGIAVAIYFGVKSLRHKQQPDGQHPSNNIIVQFLSRASSRARP